MQRSPAGAVFPGAEPFRDPPLPAREHEDGVRGLCLRGRQPQTEKMGKCGNRQKRENRQDDPENAAPARSAESGHRYDGLSFPPVHGNN